ncbi:MAG: saccharopine dehydrogenase NADP-binding domain-containing protein [Roseofilum sp. SID2]|uniref:saccharopine dehydrogenase NADP-binding domain-containing protein n=1 Tax=unclassified Roseofilum TaxID=2620099 RepID=UPI001B1AFA15|nr:MULTISPECIES: saccharopine dehydrogenase NADP-binding domain-containing protein [unclassified Roseofilum]MBP0012071.1 saccharopine dehydrogenase NADP-binding domain-containing protein [Roseofilum sp. SID3]MBP0023497.1 saccharopine dehydrogenase NADP-binding domain-containing protein [Roseofilum sp. SID2]MBP0037639.1 saccharopine dehydrogenase NADP-binding domain-containing protein [Roseofilum sp. SID1]
MAKDQILIVGGTGRIGHHVAQDLQGRMGAKIVVTGRQRPRHDWDFMGQFLALDLGNREQLQEAIAESQLVIHCAGPFHHRDARVLKGCIEQGVDYLDVSDHRSFTQKALALAPAAQEAGITAIVNTGVFPGISNSMVRQAVDPFDRVETIRLYYAVGGSGGAGITVMRTTFLGLQHPFLAWIGGQWQTIAPYSDRQIIDFGPPFDRLGVYWYDVPEAWTLAESFPVQNVITKFGSAPDIYNRLTALMTKLPQSWINHPWVIEGLSQISYRMTQISDRFSGVGIVMIVEVEGERQGKQAQYQSRFYHPHTAIAAGWGTGTLAEWIWQGKLKKPGVWPVEQAIGSDDFVEMMRSRSETEFYRASHLDFQNTWRDL